MVNFFVGMFLLTFQIFSRLRLLMRQLCRLFIFNGHDLNP